MENQVSSDDDLSYLKQQAAISNVIQNIMAYGTRGPIQSPAAAMEAARQSHLARQSQTLQNTLQQRQEDRLQSNQDAQVEAARQEAKVMAKVQEVLNDPVMDEEQKLYWLAKLGKPGMEAAKELRETGKYLKEDDPYKNHPQDYIAFLSGRLPTQELYREWTQLVAANKGPLVTVNTGKDGPELPKDHMWKDPTNPRLGVMPIPGSKTAYDQDQDAMQRQSGIEREAVAAQTVFEDTQRVLDVLDKYGAAATGPAASATKWLAITPAGQVNKHIESIKGNVGIDSLLKIKREGSGLGQVPQSQLDMLAGLLGKLDPDMKLEDVRYNVERIQEIYADIVKKSGGDPKALYQERQGRLSGRPSEALAPDAPPEAVIDFYFRRK